MVPRPSSYPLLGPKYLLLGAIYPQLRAQGGSCYLGCIRARRLEVSWRPNIFISMGSARFSRKLGLCKVPQNDACFDNIREVRCFFSSRCCYYCLGMDALVTVCSRNANVANVKLIIVVLASSFFFFCVLAGWILQLRRGL